MKPPFPLLLLFALPFLALGQTSDAGRRLAFTLAPNTALILSAVDAGEQSPQIGVHARVDGEWRLAQRLWLRVGAGYAHLQYKSDIGKRFQWPSQVQNGVYDPSLPAEKRYVSGEDNMLTVPVALRYYFGAKQQLYADLESGASLIFVQSDDALVRPNLGLSAGWQNALGANIWWFVQPALHITLNKKPLTDLNNSRQHACNFGLELGLRRAI